MVYAKGVLKAKEIERNWVFWNYSKKRRFKKGSALYNVIVLLSMVKRPNIDGQTSEICLTQNIDWQVVSNALEKGWKEYKGKIFCSSQTKNMECFATWQNGQAFCLTGKFFMIATHVWSFSNGLTETIRKQKVKKPREMIINLPSNFYIVIFPFFKQCTKHASENKKKTSGLYGFITTVVLTFIRSICTIIDFVAFLRFRNASTIRSTSEFIWCTFIQI